MIDVAVPDQLQQLCETFRHEQDMNRREMEEIERLLRQTQTDAEKLQQRELSASTQVRHVQTNLERFSKEEIRNMFAMVQEIQVRLLSVRSQVEQLQAKRQRLIERQEELAALVPVLEVAHESLLYNGSSAPVTADHPSDSLISEVMEAQEKERRSGAHAVEPGAARRNLRAPAVA